MIARLAIASDYALASLGTLLLFAALPLFDLFIAAHPQTKQLVLRDIETITLPTRPPAPQPPRASIALQISALPTRPDTKAASVPPALQHAPQLPYSLNLQMHRAERIFPLTELANPAQQVFELTDLDQVPRAISRIDPIYPRRALALHKEGYVTVEFIVEPDGRCSNIQLLESIPAGTFDQTVLNSVKNWRFKPGSRGGEAVPVRVQQTLNFNLER